MLREVMNHLKMEAMQGSEKLPPYFREKIICLSFQIVNFGSKKYRKI